MDRNDNEHDDDNDKLPSKVIVTVGTYEGVVAGWELVNNKASVTINNKSRDEEESEDGDDDDDDDDNNDNDDNNNNSSSSWSKKLKLAFASPIHSGSVRSLCLAATAPQQQQQQQNKKRKRNQLLLWNDFPGSLLSCGYDETIKVHDWHKRLTSSGEIRTPNDFGTPTCTSFAPPQQQAVAPGTPNATPSSSTSTHCLVGFSEGKLVIYKKRDWSIQHVLSGHVGGISSLAVHPTGKLALTGGTNDGKLKLWDLTKGRLSYVNTIPMMKNRKSPIVSIRFTPDGMSYGFAHSSHATVRNMMGETLLDIDLSGGGADDAHNTNKINELTFLQGPEGLFVACACNDGSLPVLQVQDSADDEREERRAIMAMEPVDQIIAGEERLKCISCVGGYHVAVANSAGVVFLMNLEGSIRMMMTTNDSSEDDDDQDEKKEEDKEDSDTDDDEEEEDAAVEIIDAVRLGTGARITSLVAWSSLDVPDDALEEEEEEEETEETTKKRIKTEENTTTKKKKGEKVAVQEDNQAEMEKARALVAQAKKLEKKKSKKKKNKKRDKKQ